MAFVPVSSADAARMFYRDTLGLRMISEDGFALVFDVESVMLRTTLIPNFTPQQSRCWAGRCRTRMRWRSG